MTQLSRRALLGLLAAGAVAPRLSFARGAGSTRRLITLIAPNGMDPHLWTPEGTGTAWVASPILEALGAARAHTTVITGLQSYPDQLPREHGASMAMTLTPGELQQSDRTTFDQRIGALAETGGPQGVLNLSAERAQRCAADACAKFHGASHAGSVQPVPRTASPQALFAQFFGTRLPLGDVSGEALDALHRRVLAHAADDLASMAVREESSDGARVDAYAEALTQLEQQLDDETRCATPEAPADAAPGDPQAPLRDLLDLVVAGMACDRVRVTTMMLGNAQSLRDLGFLGFDDTHHSVSHTGWDEPKIAMGRWEVAQFTWLVERLAATSDPAGGTLLDHTDVLFFSPMGDGNSHDRTSLPVLLAGPGARQLGAGAHLAHPGEELATLFAALMRAHGATDTLGVAPLADLG